MKPTYEELLKKFEELKNILADQNQDKDYDESLGHIITKEKTLERQIYHSIRKQCASNAAAECAAAKAAETAIERIARDHTPTDKLDSIIKNMSIAYKLMESVEDYIVKLGKILNSSVTPPNDMFIKNLLHEIEEITDQNLDISTKYLKVCEIIRKWKTKVREEEEE